MMTISAAGARRNFTQRQLYFFLLWLPLLMHLRYLHYTAMAHVPFALIHSLTAHRKPTAKLLGSSWQVPFKAAGVTAVEFLALSAYTVAMAQGPLWSALLIYTAASFAASAVMLAVGWLLLLTLANRWPLDRDNPNRFR